jgi:hypothetical protein
VSLVKGTLSALRRIGIVIGVAIAFLFGMATTVYLSLRSSEVKVPEVVGKDRFDAEHILGNAGLNFRVRATRPSTQQKPETVLFQLPRAGEVVKTGQTVAMDISRVAKEGETAETVAPESKAGEEKAADNRNTNEATSASNENKPKRNKNTNKNANENLSANGNSNRSNRNANRTDSNSNTNHSTVDANTGTNVNSNRTGGNSNVSPTHSPTENVNRRPAPRPSPTVKDDNRENL